MQGKTRVYIPCVPTGPGMGIRGAVVEGCSGQRATVTAGRFEIVESRLRVIAEYLGQVEDRHRVRFADGQTMWVNPSDLWKYNPDDFESSIAA